MTTLLATVTSSGGMHPLIVLGIGFVGGLIVGWNFLPQPKWLAKRFKKRG